MELQYEHIGGAISSRVRRPQLLCRAHCILGLSVGLHGRHNDLQQLRIRSAGQVQFRSGKCAVIVVLLRVAMRN